MKTAIKTIWNSKSNNLVIFLTFVTLGGTFLCIDRPNVSTTKDLIEVKGTLNHIEQVLVYSRRIKKTEKDSTYHIYLNEYPSKFQVSYMSYNRKEFYKTTSNGDTITLNIPRNDIDRIRTNDAKIRSFSLTVNDKIYLSLDDGLSGFGKGYFELGLIIIPLIINFFVINEILNRKRKAANNG